MQSGRDTEHVVLPVIEERLVTARRVVETGTVRVHTRVDERQIEVREQLVHGHVEVDRVAIGEEVLMVPPMREEGDTIVISVVREELIVTKRLILVEEVRLRRVETVEDFTQPVTLRTQSAVVERDTANHPPKEK